MDEEENHYVSQLREIYSSCDTTGTGFLDRDELTQLCLKLHLEKQLPLLLHTLLGNDHFARVNFEEFKDGFVAVLSSTAGAEPLEENSLSLESAVPSAVPPKYVSGSRWYGRRSHPEPCSPAAGAKRLPDPPAGAPLRSQLRRAASLESVESFKSDEEAESLKEPQNELFEAQGQLPAWGSEVLSSPQKSCSPTVDFPESHVRGLWEELGVGSSGHLTKQELAVVCQSIGFQALEKEELQDLFSKLDRDGDGRVSLAELRLGLSDHGAVSLLESCASDRPSRPWSHSQVLEEGSCHTATTSSLVSLCSGPRLLCSLDDGTGFAFPEQLIALWAQEGIQNGAEVLQTLDFSVDEKVNLSELTWALENELVAIGSATQQAALACYRQELSFRQGQAEQMVKERDKARQDLERAEKRNLDFVREMDDCHSALEQLTEKRIKHLEQDYRERLSLLRAEVEVEREVLWEQAHRQRAALELDLEHLRTEEAGLREKLTLALKENSRLQKDITELVGKLSESEKLVLKLQKDLESVLKDKLEPQSTELLAQEERFAEIIQEYKRKCRDLQDQNDELQIALEGLQAKLPPSPRGLPHTPSDGQLLLGRSPAGTVLLVGDSVPASIEMEIMLEQVKERYRDLKIQLETKVNCYERELAAMQRDFAQEKKDMERAFRLQVRMLEEQKAELEVLLGRSQELLRDLQDRLRDRTPSPELEQRCVQALAGPTRRLALDKLQQEDELQHLREEAEVKENRSCLEAQQAAPCQTEHPQEMEAAHQRLLLEVRAATEQLGLERGRRDQQEILQELLSEEQAQLGRIFAQKQEPMELALQEQAGTQREGPGLRALVKADASQTGTDSPVAPSAGRRKQVHADGKPDSELASCGDSERLSLGEDGPGVLRAEPVAFVPSGIYPHELPRGAGARVAPEELVLSANGPFRLSPPETPEPPLRAEGGAGSAPPEPLEPQRRPSAVDSGETHKQAVHQSREPAPTGGPVPEESSPAPGLQPRGVEEARAALEREKENTRARLLQLEDVVRALEQDAAAREGGRMEVDRLSEANSWLSSELERIQEELKAAERTNGTQRKEIEVLRRDKEQACSTLEELSKQNQKYKAELSQLGERLLQLREEAAAQQVRDKQNHSTIRLLWQRLEEARGQQGLQEDHEKQLKAAEAQAEEVRTILKNVEVLLQDKVRELKEQLDRNTRADLLLKELYVENAHLMKQLQVAEEKRRSAERSVRLLEEKVRALNRLLSTVSAASLSV